MDKGADKVDEVNDKDDENEAEVNDDGEFVDCRD